MMDVPDMPWQDLLNAALKAHHPGRSAVLADDNCRATIQRDGAYSVVDSGGTEVAFGGFVQEGTAQPKPDPIDPYAELKAAWEDGKTIQLLVDLRGDTESAVWVDIAPGSGLPESPSRYRVKPDDEIPLAVRQAILRQSISNICGGNVSRMVLQPGDVAWPDATKPNPVTAPGVLDRAAGHMRDRAATYDAPGGERSMGKAVHALNSITGLQLDESHGWLLMLLLKNVRLFASKGYHDDSAEDAAAYAALLAESKWREGKGAQQ